MDAFLIKVDHEAMVVTLKASPALPDSIKTPEQLAVILKENNVFQGIDKVAIQSAFEELPKLKEEKTFVIARGKEPVNGKNGKLEFYVNVSGRAQYVGAGNDTKLGGVDYKKAVVVESVVEGAHLITVVPPTLGEDGFSLTGKTIVAKNGKEVNIVLSEGTEFNKDRTKVIATNHGRPVLSHGIFSVRSVYEVQGDVCFETGNIEFDGHVYISGNVQDEFSIEAESIEIVGSVGSADIKCKGALFIKGGVNGRGKANIVCGADATIKYINSAKLEVKGNLFVNKEIVNSEIRCNGKVDTKKIIGGDVAALKGIEAFQLGSEVGTPTIIKPGMNYEVERIENAMSVLSAQIEAALKPIKNNLGDHDYYKKLDDSKKEEVIKRYTYFKRIKSGYLRLLQGKEKILADERFEPIKEVVVQKRLYQDVQIQTTYCAKRYMVELSGPAKIIEDIDNASMKSVSYNLSSNNEEISEDEV